MNTPGKQAYKRKSAGKAPKPTYNQKETAMNGSDAKRAYVRKKQPVSAKSVAKRLRGRLSAS